jgi:hypothetical protein
VSQPGSQAAVNTELASASGALGMSPRDQRIYLAELCSYDIAYGNLV